ncbi:MAG: hypothetical protein R3B51_08070 [Thermodesulfobacteriota bacterium]
MNFDSFKKTLLLPGLTAAAFLFLSLTASAATADHASPRISGMLHRHIPRRGRQRHPEPLDIRPRWVMFITSSAQKALDFTDEQGAWKKTENARPRERRSTFHLTPTAALRISPR